MNTSTHPSASSVTASMSDTAADLSTRLDRSLQDGQQVAADAVQTLTRRVDGLRAETATAVSDAAALAQDLAHRGLDRARSAVSHARDSAAELRDQTARRVQADPMKALLVAAAAGAVSAIVVQWLSRSRHTG